MNQAVPDRVDDAVNDADARLAPGVRAVLADLRTGIARDQSTATVEDLRADHRRQTDRLTPRATRPQVASAEEIVIGPDTAPVRIRVYRPRHEPPLMPTVLWLHGGGWMTGDLETADVIARELCASGTVVVTVDYRLMPEHPFPAGLMDCSAALEWVLAHVADLGGDHDAVGIGGDSAGGNLAALLTQQAHAGGVRIAGQLLLYPVVDLTDDVEGYPSRTEHSENHLLTGSDLARLIELYVPSSDDRAHPSVSPLRGDLSHGIPTVIVTAELDPLRDEGERFGRRLAAAGTEVVHHRAAGLPHGAFDMLTALPTAREVLLLAIRDFHHAMSTSAPTDAAIVRADQTSDLSAFFLRYSRLRDHPMLVGSSLPVEVRDALEADLLGMTEERRAEVLTDLDIAVGVAVDELLEDPGLAAAARALPFAPGARVVALGDSITADHCSWADMLQQICARVGVDLTVINAAISADTTSAAIARFNLVEAANPDWVIVMLGTNDARRHGYAAVRVSSEQESVRNQEALAAAVAAIRGARLVRMTPLPVLEERLLAWEPFTASRVSWRAEDLRSAADAVRAADNDAVDLYAAFDRPELPTLLLPDGVHPTVAGQQRIVRTLLTALARSAHT